MSKYKKYREFWISYVKLEKHPYYNVNKTKPMGFDTKIMRDNPRLEQTHVIEIQALKDLQEEVDASHPNNFKGYKKDQETIKDRDALILELKGALEFVRALNTEVRPENRDYEETTKMLRLRAQNALGSKAMKKWEGRDG